MIGHSGSMWKDDSRVLPKRSCVVGFVELKFMWREKVVEDLEMLVKTFAAICDLQCVRGSLAASAHQLITALA